KKWEYKPLVIPAETTTYFNGTLIVYTSPIQVTALDINTGKPVWQYAATQKRPSIFSTSGHLFVVEEKGVKEYRIGKTTEGVTDKETLTGLAQAYLAKGDRKQSELFVEKAAGIEANYPPLVLVRARLLKAQGNLGGAGKELARYARLVGLD